MAIKDLIGRGVGFAPNSISFIVTHGLTPAPTTVVKNTEVPKIVEHSNPIRKVVKR